MGTIINPSIKIPITISIKSNFQLKNIRNTEKSKKVISAMFRKNWMTTLWYMIGVSPIPDLAWRP